MSKIPNDSIPAVYASAVAVYQGQITRSSATERLVSDYRLNRTSAQSMLTDFSAMMTGKAFKRTLNDYATEYFLRGILTDFGVDQFNTACQAVEQHADYYEEKRQIHRNSLRALLAKLKLLPTERPLSAIYPDDIEDPVNDMIEGALLRITVNRYERDPVARQKCIEHYGPVCVVCGFDFEKRYGAIGAGFIHVHHLVDIASIGGRYQVDPVRDLRPVCPNCHAMLHQERPAMSIENLKQHMVMDMK